MSAPPVNVRVRVDRGRDGELVVLGAWCDKCGDEVMPVDGACPWCHAQIVDEETLPAREMVAQLEQGGRAMPAAEKRTCKIEGCGKDAVTSGPPWGTLCATHLAAAKSARGSRSNGAVRDDSFAARVRAAAKVARAFDSAARKLEQVGAPEKVKAEFDEAVRRAQAVASPENLARLEAASKAIRRGTEKREAIRQEYDTARQKLSSTLAQIAGDLRSDS